MNDLISRHAAIEAIKRDGSVVMAYTEVMSIDEIAERALKASQQSMVKILHDLPSAEPLTDAEQRIFLKAISREEEVCRKVDAEWGNGDEDCKINLVHACREIVRKVKGALWT